MMLRIPFLFLALVTSDKRYRVISAKRLLVAPSEGAIMAAP
jgi:hypothetical protein